MGLEEPIGWGGGDFEVTIWDANHKEMGPFLWGRHLETPCKDFNLAIGGGLGSMNWSKNEAGKGFIFHAIIPTLYPFW